MEEDKSLYKKNAMVIGGVSGIGLAIAKELLEEGIVNLIILDIDTEAAEKVLPALKNQHKNANIEFIKFDITDTAEIEEKFDYVGQKFDSIDLLVNSAGNFDGANVKSALDVNLYGLINTSLKMLKMTDKKNGGRGATVVNIASILGLQTVGITPLYSATKFGVVGFSCAIGDKFHYDTTGVRFITICPGYTTTPCVEKFVPLNDSVIVLAERYMRIKQFQPVEHVARETVKVYKMADSGSVWVIENSMPVYQHVIKHF